MKNYSFATFENARLGISQKGKNRISAYTRKDVEEIFTFDTTSNSKYWRVLTEGIKILKYHPNPIVRHEAAFFFGQFSYRSEVEHSIVIRDLRTSFRQDPSTVVKHESLESAGETFSIASVGAAADMAKILEGWISANDDVVQTAKESFDNIVAWLEKEGYHETVEELFEWRRIMHTAREKYENPQDKGR